MKPAGENDISAVSYVDSMSMKTPLLCNLNSVLYTAALPWPIECGWLKFGVRNVSRLSALVGILQLWNQ